MHTFRYTRAVFHCVCLGTQILVAHDHSWQRIVLYTLVSVGEWISEHFAAIRQTEDVDDLTF